MALEDGQQRVRTVSDGRNLKRALFAVFAAWMALVIANAAMHGPANVDTILMCAAAALAIAFVIAGRTRGKRLSAATIVEVLLIAIAAGGIVALGVLLGIGR